MINDNSLLGIAFTGIVCVVAALNFILDFDTIENSVKINKKLSKIKI